MVWKRVINVAPYLKGKSESEVRAFLEGLRVGKETFGNPEPEEGTH